MLLLWQWQTGFYTYMFIDAMRSIAEEAATNPELVKMAPHTTCVGRLDEVAAARKLLLRWKPRLRRSRGLEA